ncbi:MAG: F0F1 ATP synthase subunit A [Planctomycetaceae bacterium]|nr:F0F1 ATP synthase subunit A [Planctomycetaceae bacterium]
MLAASDIISHMIDHPWPHCQVTLGPITLTLMSGGIAVMILVAVLLAMAVPVIARRREEVPTGGYNLLEAMVVFVRDMIAKPTLGDHAYRFLPLLLTMFIFILALNLMGLVPLESILHAAGVRHYIVGGPTTSVPAITGALACVSLVVILGNGLWESAHRHHLARGWSMGLCLAISPLLWAWSITPKIPGMAGAMLAPLLMVLELVGALIKIFALMIRLFANMLSGHTMIAILIMLGLQAADNALRENLSLLPLSILPILGGVLVNVLDVLVAVLQAYIFTFLTAVYLALYSGGGH